MLGLPDDARVVLILGQVHELRYARELVKAAQELPEKWVMVLHGPTYVDDLEQLNTAGRARLSRGLVPERDLSDLVASADVGVALYASEPVNDYMTGRASEKVARYAQAGVPTIAFDYPSYRDVFERYHCGRLIADVGQMPTAIGEILRDYEGYRAGALRAYTEVYEFSKHFSPVIDWIDAL